MLSIIVCSVNPEAAERLQKNIAVTVGNVPYEIITFDNRTVGYGICKVYNLCTEKSRYDNLCFVHEDVQFDTIGWGEKIVQKLAEPNCGVIGFAGVKIRADGMYGLGVRDVNAWRSNYIQHRKNQWYIGSFENPKCSEFSSVAVLDGMCLFVSRRVWSKVRFDEQTFPGFHLYDLDFTTAVSVAGYTNYVCQAVIVEHFSEGTYTMPWFEATRDYNEKWKNVLPVRDTAWPLPSDITKYVREEEYGFIKNMMKSRTKCSWSLVEILCNVYCGKYKGMSALIMRYHERRYREKWLHDGLL